jgi:hypothetical protein
MNAFNGTKHTALTEFINKITREVILALIPQRKLRYMGVHRPVGINYVKTEELF